MVVANVKLLEVHGGFWQDGSTSRAFDEEQLCPGVQGMSTFDLAHGGKLSSYVWIVGEWRWQSGLGWLWGGQCIYHEIDHCSSLPLIRKWTV